MILTFTQTPLKETSIVLMSIAAGLFLIKIIMAEYFRLKKNIFLEPKLVVWYSPQQIKSPYAEKSKQLMKLSNILSSLIWLFVIVSVFLAFSLSAII